ncbi:hypothetical protein BDZ89DRAFT_1060532, partial [Hymenopellis radicata]
MLLSLPTEILHSIFEQLDQTEWKQLRLTNKHLCDIISPLLFPRLVLDIKYSHSRSSRALLKGVASKKTQVASHVETLEIHSLMPPRYKALHFWKRLFKRRQRKYQTLEKHLLAALPKFISVTCLILDMSAMRYVQPSKEDRIIKSLSSLPSLAHLSLLMYREVGTSIPNSIGRHFKTLQSLHFAGDAQCYHGIPRALVANSPALKELSVDSSDLALSALFSEVDALPLKSITLGNTAQRFLDNMPAFRPHIGSLSTFVASESIDVPVDFWSVLASQQVILQTLSVHRVDRALLDYLSSYAGLVDLTLSSGPLENGVESRSLADTFYQSVLLKHAPTLKSLRLSTPHDGPWCLGDLHVDHVIACNHLSFLRVAIGSSEENTVSDPLNVITRLLNSVCDGRLPLQFLEISFATPAMPAHEDLVISMYSRHAVRGHHRINELISKYFCTSPTPAMLDLALSTGHMNHSKLVQVPEQSELWHFELQ